MSLASLLASSFLANVFALSAAYKVANRDEYLDAVWQFSVLRRLPPWLLPLVAAVVPLAEGAVAVCLLVPGTTRYGSFGAAVLATSFFTVMAGETRTAIANCGCWGVVSTDIPKGAFLVRNAILLAAAAAAVGLAVAPAADPSWSWPHLVAAICLTLPFALVALEVPQIAHVAAIQPAARREA